MFSLPEEKELLPQINGSYSSLVLSSNVRCSERCIHFVSLQDTHYDLITESPSTCMRKRQRRGVPTLGPGAGRNGLHKGALVCFSVSPLSPSSSDRLGRKWGKK